MTQYIFSILQCLYYKKGNHQILIFIFLSLLWHFPTIALKESNLHLIKPLLQEGRLYQRHSFQGELEVNIRYVKIGQKRGSKGSLIVVNGLFNNFLQYMEFFYDLQLLGWSPIYSYDHRGQGFSQRIISDSQATHVESYDFYRKDLSTFIDIVLEDSAVDKKSLFLVAHSMGAAIALSYLQTRKKNQEVPFQSVVLSSPMLGINLYFPNSVFSILSSMMNIFCSFSSCTRSFPHKKMVDSVRGKKVHSQRRIYVTSLIEKQFPHTRLKIITYRWLSESIKAIKKLHKQKNIQKIKTPFLLLQAQNDKLVNNSDQDSFCNALPQCCHKATLSGGHELLFAKDSIRDKAMNKILLYFSKEKYYQKLCNLKRE